MAGWFSRLFSRSGDESPERSPWHLAVVALGLPGASSAQVLLALQASPGKSATAGALAQASGLPLKQCLEVSSDLYRRKLVSLTKPTPPVAGFEALIISMEPSGDHLADTLQQARAAMAEQTP